MATGNPYFNVPGQVAGADHSANQFKFVKSSTPGVVLAGNGEQALGILQNDPNDTEGATVTALGTSKVKSGAAYAIDTELASDAAGLAVAATTGERVLAYALEASGGANEIHEVLVTCPGGQLN